MGTILANFGIFWCPDPPNKPLISSKIDNLKANDPSSPKKMVKSVKQSINRMNISSLDICYLHQNEISIISNIGNLIGINDTDFESIKAMFVPNTKAAYQILGLDTNANNLEIKIAYRKMATKYHPDKVSHLGDEFSKVAEEKFKSINDAYQKIKKERNI